MGDGERVKHGKKEEDREIERERGWLMERERDPRTEKGRQRIR